MSMRDAIQAVFARLPINCFPLKLEAFKRDGTLVWSTRAEGPGPVLIPPLFQIHREKLKIRVTYADGQVIEHGPDDAKSKDPAVAVPEALCSFCGFHVNAATHHSLTTMHPKPNDVAVCFNCGGANVYTAERSLRQATEAELARMRPHMRRLVEEAQAHIRKRGPLPAKKETRH